MTALRGQEGGIRLKKRRREKKRLAEWCKLFSKVALCPFWQTLGRRQRKGIEGSLFFQGFDRTIFSRQIYEMEVEFSAIIDGAGAMDSMFLGGIVQSNLGKDSLGLATFLSGETCFSVGETASACT